MWSMRRGRKWLRIGVGRRVCNAGLGGECHGSAGHNGESIAEEKKKKIIIKIKIRGRREWRWMVSFWCFSCRSDSWVLTNSARPPNELFSSLPIYFCSLFNQLSTAKPRPSPFHRSCTPLACLLAARFFLNMHFFSYIFTRFTASHPRSA